MLDSEYNSALEFLEANLSTGERTKNALDLCLQTGGVFLARATEGVAAILGFEHTKKHWFTAKREVTLHLFVAGRDSNQQQHADLLSAFFRQLMTLQADAFMIIDGYTEINIPAFRSLLLGSSEAAAPRRSMLSTRSYAVNLLSVLNNPVLAHSIARRPIAHRPPVLLGVSLRGPFMGIE